MKKSITGYSMGRNFAFMFVLVASLFCLVGTADAQNNLNFRPLNIDYYINGAAGGHVTWASAILAASDSVNGQVYDKNRDGKLADTLSGQIFQHFAKNKNEIQLPSYSIKKPIIANAEENERLMLVAVIENVTPSIVQSIVNNNDAAAKAEIINKVTAQFSSQFFGFDKVDINWTDKGTGLNPNDVTGVGKNPGMLGLINPKNTGEAGVRANSSTTVIVIWSSASLVISSTDVEYSKLTLGATVGINKGATTDHNGKANYMGIEVGKYPSESGPRFKVGSTVSILDATDTVSRGFFGLGAPTTTPLDPSKAVSVSPAIPFQFRQEDIIHLRATVEPRQAYDGEPDEYFGGGGTDPFYFVNGYAPEGFPGDFSGFAKAVQLKRDSNKASYVNNATDANLRVTVTLEDGSGDVVVTNDADAKRLMAWTEQAPGNDVYLHVLGSISTNLITSGDHDLFTANFAISDDVVSQVTNSSVQGAVDVVGPLVSDVMMDAEGATSAPWVGNKVGNATDRFDEARVTMKILTRGERSDLYSRWLNITVQPEPELGFGNWFSAVVDKPNTFAATIGAVSEQASVPNVPASAGNVPGVSASMRIENTELVTYRSAFAVISVSDDARNPAFGWTQNVGGTQIIDGALHIRDAKIETDDSFKSVSTLTPLTYKTIGKAVLPIDNNAPTVDAAKFIVTGAPSGYWGNTPSTTFNLLKSSDEALNAPINQTQIGALGLPTALSASQRVLFVTRGVAARTGGNKQNGSPVRLVVQFKPSGADPTNDTDHIITTPMNPSQMTEYVRNNFVFSITNTLLGWKYPKTLPGSYANGWNLVDATIHTGGGGNIGWATLENTSGVLVDAFNNRANYDVENASLAILIGDRIINKTPITQPNHSNPIVLDVDKPVLGLNPNVPADMWGGNRQVAQTILLITDTKNKSFGQLSAEGINLDGGSALVLGQDGTVQGFNNGAALAKDAVLEVKAGYMIIVSASFRETASGVGSTENMNELGGKSAFPFILSNEGAPDWMDTTAGWNTLYGRRFKTVSADFTDFVSTASEVLPDVTTNRSVGRTAGDAITGDIIDATWFFLIEKSMTLNADLGAAAVRSVTFAARDLSGNVNRTGIPAATAVFTQPKVSIVHFDISSQSMGRNSLAVNQTAGYTLPTGGNAFSVGGATVNIVDTTTRLVVRVGNGASGGGPFVSSDFIGADFTAFDGPLFVAPDSVSFIPKQDENGTTVTASNATAGTVLYATWNTVGPFTGAGGDTAGAKSAKVVVKATGLTLGIGSAETTAIAVDKTKPGVLAGHIKEEDLSGNSTEFSGGDQPDDNIVRPRQTVSATARITMDAAEQLIAKVNIHFMQIQADASDFGKDSLLNPDEVRRDINPNTGNVADPSILWASWAFQIEPDVTDFFGAITVHARDDSGNTNSNQGSLVTIDTTNPFVTSLILSASGKINWVTDSIGLMSARRPETFDGTVGLTKLNKVYLKRGDNYITETNFYRVGTKIGDVTTQVDANNPRNATASVRAGDELLVQAAIEINDSIFSSLDTVTADFSQVSGAGYESVAPLSDTENAPKVVGTLYHATWRHYVSSAVAAAKLAIVTVNAQDPAGEVAEGAYYTVPVFVDNTKPTVTVNTTYYKNGKPVTGTVNPNNITNYQPGDATAVIEITAVWGDAEISPVGQWVDKANQPPYSTVNVSNTPGSVFYAVAAKKGAANGLSNPNDPAYVAGVRSMISLHGDDFLSAGPFLKSMTPDSWQLIGDGPLVTANAITGVASSASDIRESTNTTLVAKFGFQGAREGILIDPGTNDGDARFVASASDNVGNVGQDPNAAVIEVDGTAPQIVAGKNFSASLTVAPGQNSEVPPVAYLPQVIWSGKVIRPTRVSRGTILQAQFTVGDTPDKTDPIEVAIETQGFKGKNYIFTNPTTIASEWDIKNASKYFVVDPSAIGQEIVGVTVEFESDVENSKQADTTLPISNAILSASFDHALFAGHDGLFDNSLTAIDGLDGIIIDATDDIDNARVAQLSNGLEIDTQGPMVIDQALINSDNEDAMRSIKGVPGGDALNFRTGSWMVWCASVVIDGTEGMHFRNLSVDWEDQFELDVDRFVNDANGNNVVESGTKIISNNGKGYYGRTVIFVTSGIKIKSNATPSTERQLTVHAEDAFGNIMGTSGTPNGPVTTPWAGINARGPRAVEITMHVKRKGTDTFISQMQGASSLGIGKNGPDSASSAFEVGPGDAFIIDATVTTHEGEAPDRIDIDLSDLYPPGMDPLVDKVVPNYSELTGEGTIHSHWETIIYNVDRVAPYPPTQTNFGVGNPNPQANNYAGSSILGGSVVFMDQDILYNDFGIQDGNGNPLLYNSAADFCQISKATAYATASLQPAVNGGLAVGYDWREDRWLNATPQQQLNHLWGAPGIMVQPGAIAKRIAWVTVHVQDRESLFAMENTISTKFTVDSAKPQVSYEIPAGLIVHVSPPEYIFNFAGPGNIWAGRIGYPSAPNVAANIPNRVVGGDIITVVVDATNDMIDGLGNDNFRMLGDNTIFDIDNAAGLSVLAMTNDLSDYRPGLDPIWVRMGEDNTPHGISVHDDLATNGADLIKATFVVEIGYNAGTSVALSRKILETTPTLLDDIGSAPYDDEYRNWIKRQITPNLSVDNTPPSISGQLEVVIESGSAMRNGQILGAGDLVADGDQISPNTVLAITATITDQVDSPIDVMNSPNYGPATIRADGIEIPANFVELVTDYAELSGPDSVSVPFLVTIPSDDDAVSTDEFRFIIDATDTLGNYRSVLSIDKFSFDASPTIKILANGTPLVSKLVSVNVADTLVLRANAFDVGGITTVSWNVVPSTLDHLLISASYDTVTMSPPDPMVRNVPVPSQGIVPLDLNLTPSLSDSPIQQVVASAQATDVDGKTVDVSNIIIGINQPPLFAEQFAGTMTDSLGAETAFNLDAVSTGWNTAAGSEIREITISEGDSISVPIPATDVNGDALTMEATGTALTDANVLDATFIPAGANGLYTFNPGYLVATGDTADASFVLDVVVMDGSDISPDNTQILVNVQAQAAMPEVTLLSSTVGGQNVGASFGSSVNVPEGSELQLVVQGTDAGMEDLAFSIGTDPSVPEVSIANQKAAPGVTTATVKYTPGPDDSSLTDLITYVSPIDPFELQLNFANSAKVGTGTLVIDIINVSRPPIVTASASVNGGAAANVPEGATVTADPGQTVVLNFLARDPDGDGVLFPNAEMIAGPGWTTTGLSVTNFQANSVEGQMTVSIPVTAAVGNESAHIIFNATDTKQTSTSASFFISVIPTCNPAPIAEAILGQGLGGQQGQVGAHVVNIRNMDPAVGDLTKILRSYSAAQGSFLYHIGGGTARAVYPVAGDLNMDGSLDIVTTLGPIIADATYPNIVIVRDAVTRDVVYHTFEAFHDSSTEPINYAGGELRTAVGDFIGSGRNQIAIAQGIKGNGKIRLWQPTGNPKPNGWEVVGQFDGLSTTAQVSNASGGLSLASGDLDKDGLDELIVAQTNSNNSQTIFHVLDITASGTVGARKAYAGFIPQYRGNGGLEIAVADLDGDGKLEIVAASAGNSRDFGDDRDTVPLSLVCVIIPQVSGGAVTGFSRATSGVINVLPQAINPSGSVSIAGGELNGCADGDELLVGTGSLVKINGGGFDVSPVLPAPEPRYRPIKISFDGTTVTGLSSVVGPNTGYIAFEEQYVPTSGATWVAIGECEGCLSE